MTITIPDDLLDSLDMSEEEVLKELAVTLYAVGKISFGKARRLARLDWYRFREVLTQRGIPIHYDAEEFEEDLKNLESLSTKS